MTSILPFAIEDAGTLSTELSQQIQQLLLEFAQNYPVMGSCWWRPPMVMRLRPFSKKRTPAFT